MIMIIADLAALAALAAPPPHSLRLYRDACKNIRKRYKNQKKKRFCLRHEMEV